MTISRSGHDPRRPAGLAQEAPADAAPAIPPAPRRAGRKRHRLTRAEPPRLLGISPRHYGRLEAGHAPIPRTVALACGWIEVTHPSDDATLSDYDGEALEQ